MHIFWLEGQPGIWAFYLPLFKMQERIRTLTLLTVHYNALTFVSYRRLGERNHFTSRIPWPSKKLSMRDSPLMHCLILRDYRWSPLLFCTASFRAVRLNWAKVSISSQKSNICWSYWLRFFMRRQIEVLWAIFSSNVWRMVLTSNGLDSCLVSPIHQIMSLILFSSFECYLYEGLVFFIVLRQ